MCGRIIQASPPDLLALKIVNGLEDRDNRVPTGTNSPPRYNGAPSQQHWVIRRNPQTGECSLDLLQWGLLPNWCKDPKALRPINAMAETVATKPYFREGYRKRRCIVPVDGFFEWMAVKGSKTKQPYAIAMRDRSPFGIAGVWENWRDPATSEWLRTFAIITVPANSLVSRIHDRMPAIIAPDEFEGWLSEDENPRNLMRPFDPNLMTMWPVSTRVNSPKNDDPGLLNPLDVAGSQAV
jgi:putative SOS response-associated peptidase YedK